MIENESFIRNINLGPIIRQPNKGKDSVPIDSFTKRFGQIVISSLGLCVPFVAAIVALPVLIQNLGINQFALFAILWTLIGYTSMFEFGLGKGVTRELSGRSGDTAFAATVISTSCFIAMCVSVIGIAILWLGLPLVFRSILEGDTIYLNDAIRAGRILLFAFPFIILTPIFYGVLESRQDFKLVAKSRAIIGFFIFALPAIVSFGFPDVPSTIATIALVRCLSTVILGLVALRKTGIRLSSRQIDIPTGSNLLRYGGWMTVTTLTGPILIYADRFLLTKAYGLAATSLYLIPFEILIRFMILPRAISSVVFPRFASGTLEKGEGIRIIREGEMIILLAFGIPAIILIFAVLIYSNRLSEIVGTIEIWELAAIFVGGFVLTSLTYIPQAYLLATGHAATVAKFSLLELVLWLGYMPYLISTFGAYGAAIGFVMRSLISLIGNATLVHWTK